MSSPDPRSIDRLTRRAPRVDDWNVHHLAARNINGTTTLRLAGNEMSRSTLPMMPRHVRSSPDSANVDVAEVPVVPDFNNMRTGEMLQFDGVFLRKPESD